MSAAKLNFIIDQGATWRYRLVVKAGPTEDAPALNLTGYSVRMQIRREVDSALLILELSTSNGRVTITPLTGTIDMYIAATDTAAFYFRTAVYDLELIGPDGEVTRLLRGTVQLIEEVTR